MDPTGHSWLSKVFGGAGKAISQYATSIVQVVGVVLAPFTGGASLYLTYAAMAYSGYQSAQAGNLGMWAVSVGVSNWTNCGVTVILNSSMIS